MGWRTSHGAMVDASLSPRWLSYDAWPEHPRAFRGGGEEWTNSGEPASGRKVLPRKVNVIGIPLPSRRQDPISDCWRIFDRYFYKYAHVFRLSVS